MQWCEMTIHDIMANKQERRYQLLPATTEGAFTVGLKFASIHVYDLNNKITADQFSQVYLDQLHDLEKEHQKRIRMMQALSGKSADSQMQSWIQSVIAAEREEVEFVESGDWHSAYDRNYTFETIEDAVASLSRVVALPVFYATVYDDDILLFGVCIHGEFVTKQSMGGYFALKEYGVEKRRADAHVLCRDLNLQNKVLAEKLCKQRNIFKAIETLEKLIGIQMFLRYYKQVLYCLNHIEFMPSTNQSINNLIEPARSADGSGMASGACAGSSICDYGDGGAL